jgi:hypothetical protein
MGIRKNLHEITIFRANFPRRTEILCSLSKKQEYFASVPDDGMKPFFFIMAMRTPMAYDGIGKCVERAPRTGDENSIHGLY